jgi:hypothetical protein
MNKLNYKHIDLSNTPLALNDISKGREKAYIEDLFFDSAIYSRIKKSIENETITLIIGHPLSGKTRVVYDTLKQNKIWNLIIPRKNKEIREYFIPTTLSNILVVLDDVDDFCYPDSLALFNLLKYIVSRDIKCVITCRKGPELAKFQNYINSNFSSTIFLNTFDIQRFDKNNDQVKKFLEINREKFKSDIRNFDGNFGSIVLPLDKMRERFQNLLTEDKDNDISLAILLGLKLHFHFLNYESSKSEYADEKIKNFAQRFLGNLQLSGFLWENGKNTIISNNTSLNFIVSNKSIFIEEAYLDFLKDTNGNTIDVIYSDFDYKRLKYVLDTTYTLEERKVWGFLTDIRDYNNAIEKTKTFEDAETIFKNFPEDIQPDAGTFSLLMNKTNDKDKLEALFEELMKCGIDPKFIPLHSFISGYNSFINLFDALLKFDKASLNSINSVSRKLIKLAAINPKENLVFLFSKFDFKSIYSNPLFSKVCLQCCNDEDDFKKYVEPHIGSLNTLDYPLLLNFIKLCSKINKPIALNLLHQYCNDDTFEYLNIKANCIKENTPLEALELYSKAEKVALSEIESATAKCNFCNLVYEKQITEKIDVAINYCSISIRLNIRQARYLREVFVLIEIWKTPINNLTRLIDTIDSRNDMTKSIFRRIYAKIIDSEKKKLVAKLFNISNP